MPKTPTGAKRPADVTQNAVMVMRIATGEVEEHVPAKSVAAQSGKKGGLKGGKARAATMSKEERSAAAKKAATSRWKNRP